MKVSDYIADELAEQRVPAVFELVGGMITHLLDSIHVRGTIPIISMRHEQGAAFAAEGCARMSGIPAVAMATSGPGATNLLTGIGSCYFDSTPAVFITGQVNRSEQKRDREIRQLGFQETDIVSMAAAVTKRAWRVEDEAQVPAILREAFHLASTGRRGPVLVDVPMDIQRAQIDPPGPVPHPGTPSTGLSEADAITIREALISARKPMILAGGGIRTSNATVEFRNLVCTAGLPVVHSLMGVDLLAYADPLNAGMIGSYGNRWANLALSQCDCLIVLGSRLDVRQTGADTRSFKGQRPIFHVDCEKGELNNRIENCHVFVSDLAPAMDMLAAVLAPVADSLRKLVEPWQDAIASLRNQWPDTGELATAQGINPNSFMHDLSRALPDVAAYVADVGQHQMWAAQSLELSTEQRFLTSGGMGSMGFALPASIGAAVCSQNRPVVVIAGDGGFQCNIQELQTIAHFNLPIKIVVLNNQCHGMVRQFQESYFDGRYQSTMWGYSAPEFVKVSEAFGIPARLIGEKTGVQGGIEWLAQHSGGPCLLEVAIPQLTNAYPKLAFGHGLDSMEPFVKPLDMEGT